MKIPLIWKTNEKEIIVFYSFQFREMNFSSRLHFVFGNRWLQRAAELKILEWNSALLLERLLP